MKTISVRVRELDKGDKRLTLQNLRDEIVGFLYRDTIARSTYADMQFYILLFFAAIPVTKKTSLEAILDEGIPKFDLLNDAFQRKRGYLRANEYREMVEQYGLSDLFYKDLFFVIAGGVLNIADIKTKFGDIIGNDPALVQLFDRLQISYLPRLEASFERFKSSRIRDDRFDDNGNYHDLSKSVYRTVLMRSSRNLELNMHKYTDVKKIESNSPIDLTFLQYVDPDTVIHLWDKYHVAYYMTELVKETWEFTAHPVPGGATLLLIGKYLKHRRVNGNEDRKEKRKAKEALDVAAKQNQQLQSLNARLIESVLQSNARLESDIKELKNKSLEEAQKPRAVRDEEKLKALSKRIAKLENLHVTAYVLDEEDEPDDQTKLV